MNTDELTQIVSAHQSAISRHEQWLSDHTTGLSDHEARMKRIEEHLEASAAQQKLNQQAFAQFTAGLEELRILVANYLRGRENL